jgi:hypothetical protein
LSTDHRKSIGWIIHYDSSLPSAVKKAEGAHDIYWHGMRNLPTNSSVAQAQVYELQKE